jgi:hypothetical protein
MKRREFITLLGGAAAWPLAAHAQQDGRVQRIGYLAARDENDPVAKTNLSAFTQALADLGWTVGRNVRMDLRWPGAHVNRVRALAQELVGLQPTVATYVEERRATHSAHVKQQLAAVRMLFDWLIIGQVVPVNPAASVRGPTHVVKTGRLPGLKPNTNQGERDKWVLYLFLSTKRRQALTQITAHSISTAQRDRQLLWVLGTPGEARRTKIPAGALLGTVRRVRSQ